MDPINYNVDVADPFTSFLKGQQTGLAIQQQQADFAAKQQQQKVLSALATKANPTPQDYIRVATMYPTLAEPFQKMWQGLDANQQKATLNDASQIYSALQYGINSGDTKVATDLMQKQIDALKNSGKTNEAAMMESLKTTAADNPRLVLPSIAMTLTAALGPDKFAENFTKISTAPYEETIKGAEAENIATKNYLENQDKMETIDTKKVERQIKVIDAQLRGEDNDIKRQELELKKQDLELKRDKSDAKTGDKTKIAQASLNQVNDQIQAIDNILNNPLSKGSFLKGGVGNIAGVVTAHMPGTERRDFEQLVETVKSQQFLSNLAQLKERGGTLGQVTEREGERMEKALASLDTGQSPEAFRAAATRIKTSLQRIQQEIVASGDLPTDNAKGGKAYVMDHPKYGVVTESMINQMLEKSPGSTKQEIIEYLNSTGGK